MRIGPIQLSGKLILAPMAGVTDLPFRALCRRLGADLAVSEMLSADTSLWASRKSQKRLDHRGEPGPVSVQILGADPASMAEAARRNVDLGADLIDINMGCPAKKVCRVAAGSALLKEPEKVKKILTAVVNAVPVPVTLKIRTGWDPAHRNGVEIARIAEQAGIQALAVHGRTRACGYAGAAEYETIAAIKRAVAIPVIANGDITSPEKAREVLERTGADALMIGRAAQGRPWLFREVRHYLDTGERLPEPSPDWVRALLIQHVRALHAFHGEPHGVRIARKHIAWYCRGRPGDAAFRRRINQLERASGQLAAIERYFDNQNSQEAAA